MPTETYAVEAHLRLLTGTSENAMTRLGDRLMGISGQISGASSGATGLFRTLMGFGAAYVGVNAIANGIQRIATSAVEYANEMEGLRISTAAVMSAVDSIPFDEASRRAGRLFAQYQEDAITSVATTRDLVQISNAIMGPLRGAGESMATVRDMTNQTVTASTALGVDLAQASRDMQLMINGSAGMHVRLFQMLHATGAIAEDAQHFNAFSAPERIQRLQAALTRFQGAADAYGHSFAGVTSTFTDNVSILRGVFFGPAFDTLRTFLGSVNDSLIANRTSLQSVLQSAGQSFANHLTVALDYVFDGMLWIGRNWDGIVTKGEHFIGTVRNLLPLLQAAAQSWAAISIARSAIGMGVGLAGSAASLAGGLGYAPTGALGSLLALGGGGAGAAGAGGAAGFGALSAALTALSPLVAPLAAGFAIVASVGTVVVEHLSDFAAMFQSMSPTLGAVGEDLQGLGSDLWEILHPALTLIGDAVVGLLVPSLTLLIEGIHFLLLAIRGLLIPVRAVARWIDQYIVEPLTHSLLGALRSFADGIGEITSYINGEVDLMGVPTTPPAEHLSPSEAAARFGEIPSEWLTGPLTVPGMIPGHSISIPQDVMADFASSAETPTDRAQTVNDFRGSRITVHQEFREADPDRVAMDMMSDIAAQAESRITSPYRPPFSQ